MKKNELQIVAIIFLSIFALACHRKPPSKSREQVMQERLEERLAQWKAEVVRICAKKIDERAVAIVDSTIIANAKANRDTSGLPFVPGRPVKPDFRPPEDTLAVKPLLRTGKDSIE